MRVRGLVKVKVRASAVEAARDRGRHVPRAPRSRRNPMSRTHPGMLVMTGHAIPREQKPGSVRYEREATGHLWEQKRDTHWPRSSPCAQRMPKRPKMP